MSRLSNISLSFDEENHRLAILTSRPQGKNGPVSARPKNSTGVHASQWSYETLADLVKAGKQMREHGSTPFKILKDPVGGYSMFYRDIDQNITELRYATREQNDQLWSVATSYPAGDEISFADLEKLV